MKNAPSFKRLSVLLENEIKNFIFQKLRQKSKNLDFKEVKLNKCMH